jgi:hypothetical protein
VNAPAETQPQSAKGTEPLPPPAPFEQEADEVAANGEQPEDVQPAEEIEPSPLDEIPGEVPPASDAEIQREKDIVASAPIGYDIPMVLNDRVAAYVDYFTSRGRDFLEGSLDRSNKYVVVFQRVFEEAGIPKDLVYMAHVESGFKTSAYSRAKARGIFQFISGTGRRYGLRVDGWIDERADPMKSARAAAAYLKDLYGMFGDWYLALAAYNAGEGKIQRGMARTGKADFWSLASTRSLRSETKNYVPMILAATIIAKEPVKFGFAPFTVVDSEIETVGIEGQTDLRILARMIDVEPESLREINPHLRRGVTAPVGITDIYVPARHRQRSACAVRRASDRGPHGPRAAQRRGRRVALLDRAALRDLAREPPTLERARTGDEAQGGAGAGHPGRGDPGAGRRRRAPRIDRVPRQARRHARRDRAPVSDEPRRHRARERCFGQGADPRRPAPPHPRQPRGGHRVREAPLVVVEGYDGFERVGGREGGRPHGASRRDAVRDRRAVSGDGRSDLCVEQDLARGRPVPRQAAEDPHPLTHPASSTGVSPCWGGPRARS